MDQTLFHLINQQWTNSALDLFMAAVSNIEIWEPLLILLGAGFLIFGGFHGRAFIVCLLISLLLTESITGMLKTAVGRSRPKQRQAVRMVELQKTHPRFLALFKKPGTRYSDQTDRKRSGPSFPSGHVANNTVVAVYCTLFFRRRGWIYWIVAAAIGYSRVYLGAHWPSDVLGTFFLATGEALLMLAAFEALWRRFAPQWFPVIFAGHPSLIFNAEPVSHWPSRRASQSEKPRP